MIGGLQKDTAALSEVSGSARSAKFNPPPDGYMEQIELKDKPKRSLFRQATQFVRPRQQSTATRVIRAGQRQTCLAVLAIAALLFFCGAGALAVIYTRPTHLDTSSGSVRLVDNSDRQVETGTSLSHVSLADLPLVADFDAFDRLQRITYPTDDGRTQSGAVSAWRWSNETSGPRMELLLADTTAMLLEDGQALVLGPADGLVTFAGAADDTPLQAGASRLSDESVAQARDEHCTARGCALASCTLKLAQNTLRSASCSGVELWAWPAGVSANAAVSGDERRRRLSASSAGFGSFVGYRPSYASYRPTYRASPRPPPPPPSPSPPPPPSPSPPNVAGYPVATDAPAATWYSGFLCPRLRLESDKYFQGDALFATEDDAKLACEAGCLLRADCVYADLCAHPAPRTAAPAQPSHPPTPHPHSRASGTTPAAAAGRCAT